MPPMVSTVQMTWTIIFDVGIYIKSKFVIIEIIYLNFYRRKSNTDENLIEDVLSYTYEIRSHYREDNNRVTANTHIDFFEVFSGRRYFSQ